MEGNTCSSYVRTWVDGQKLCKNCGFAETSHTSHVVDNYYHSSLTPTAKKIKEAQEAEIRKMEAISRDNVINHVIDRNPYWKVGMIVDGRDGNSAFECEILQVNIDDESCDVKWACDGSITKRLPYCALSDREV